MPGLPVLKLPVVQKRRALHDQPGVVQRHVEGVLEVHRHKHLLVHLRSAAQLKREETIRAKCRWGGDSDSA